MRLSKSLFALVAATAVATTFITGAFAQGPGGGQMPPTAVEAVKPTVTTMTDTVSIVGTLRAAETVVIRPELPGRIEKVHFEEGKRIEKGAPLFTMDAALIRAELREWEANVAQSKRESARAEELIARKLVSQSDLDTKRAQLAVNEARLSSVKTRLAKTTIVAPFTGITGLRTVSPGEYVEAGKELVTLVMLDPVKIDFRVPENYLGRVAAGQSIHVTLDAFPGATFDGVVTAVEPTVDPNSRNVALRGELANPDMKLRPGLFARVGLELGRRENALVVPEQALWPQGNKQNVYVVENGTAKLVEVKTGVRQDGKVELLSGVTPDSLVIIAGQLKIGPGSPVAPVGAAAPKAPPAKPAAPAPKPKG